MVFHLDPDSVDRIHRSQFCGCATVERITLSVFCQVMQKSGLESGLDPYPDAVLDLNLDSDLNVRHFLYNIINNRVS